jgi:hypothetical protein
MQLASQGFGRWRLAETGHAALARQGTARPTYLSLHTTHAAK